MSEKKPTLEELEKKISGIKNTKSRMDILSSLVQDYSRDIYNEYQPQIAKAQEGQRFKNTAQKKDVEHIITAIKLAVKDKYNLRFDVTCKIADGNTLTFILDYNYDTIPEHVAAKKLEASLNSKKAAQDKRLAKWKREMLFRVANGDDFTDFKVE